jgi:hypothetical protein
VRPAELRDQQSPRGTVAGGGGGAAGAAAARAARPGGGAPPPPPPRAGRAPPPHPGRGGPTWWSMEQRRATDRPARGGGQVRLAHANVRDGVLCLGDPGGLHVRLVPDGVHVPVWTETDADPDHPLASAEGDLDDEGGRDDPGYPDDEVLDDEPDDDDLGDALDDDPDDAGEGRLARSPWVVTAWRDVAALEIDAPLTRWRYPGVLSTVVAALVGNLGIEWYPEGAGLDVELTTASGVQVVRCDGFAGRGYWEPHARVVEALLRVLVSVPATRTWLSAPGGLLGVLGHLARRGPSADALADEVRAALLRDVPQP